MLWAKGRPKSRKKEVKCKQLSPLHSLCQVSHLWLHTGFSGISL